MNDPRNITILDKRREQTERERVKSVGGRAAAVATAGVHCELLNQGMRVASLST